MHEHVIVDYATNFGKPSLERCVQLVQKLTVASNRANLGCCSLKEQEELWEKPLSIGEFKVCLNF